MADSGASGEVAKAIADPATLAGLLARFVPVDPLIEIRCNTKTGGTCSGSNGGQTVIIPEFLKGAPGIIREARQSLLGIVALIVLAVAAVVVLLFRDEVDPIVRIVVISLVTLFFVLLYLGLVWSDHGSQEHSGGRPARSRTSRRLLTLALVGGVGVLVVAVRWGLDAHDCQDARRRMTSPDASTLSGWTTIFEENQVLRGWRGGQISLYPREIVSGYQVFVHIPKNRVQNHEWTKDGGGNDMLVVTVLPP